MTLTLQMIRDHGPCASGWRKLTRALGTSDLTTELSIGDIVLANGLDDALWALRCFESRTRVAALMPAVRRSGVDAALLVREMVAELACIALPAHTPVLITWARFGLSPTELTLLSADLLVMFPPIIL